MWNKALFVSYVCHFRRGKEKEKASWISVFSCSNDFPCVESFRWRKKGGTWIIQSLTDFVYGHHYPLPRHCRKYLLRVPLFPFPRFLYFFSPVIKLRSTLRSSNSSCIKFLLPLLGFCLKLWESLSRFMMGDFSSTTLWSWMASFMSFLRIA